MASRGAFRLEPLGSLQRSLPLDRFGPMMGWKTGLFKEVYIARAEPDEPRLFHVSIMNAKIDRLMRESFSVNLRAAGSGFTLAEAFSRGAGEVIERYACCWPNDEATVFDSWEGMAKRGLEALEPESMALFSQAQYGRPGFPFVPVDRSSKLGWVPGVSLTSGKQVYLPAQIVYFRYRLQEGEKPIAYSTSSGCACATTMEEALLKGLFEQVERDAAMITWFARLKPSKVELERFPDVIEKFRSVGLFGPTRSFEVRDTTLDVPIPSFLGVARVIVARKERHFVGGAASLDPGAGVFKTLLELGQGVPFIKTILVHNPLPTKLAFDNFDDNLRFYASEKNAGHLKFLFESETISPVCPVPKPGDHGTLLKQAIDVLRSVGLDAIAVDHTTPDVACLGLIVARVYVPGFVQLGVPSTPFLGSRRLFDVPRKIGVNVTELNPLPHPYP